MTTETANREHEIRPWGEFPYSYGPADLAPEQARDVAFSQLRELTTGDPARRDPRHLATAEAREDWRNRRLLVIDRLAWALKSADLVVRDFVFGYVCTNPENYDGDSGYLQDALVDGVKMLAAEFNGDE
jgi:hypothetical protein